jgi:integrase/recombinase XerC
VFDGMLAGWEAQQRSRLLNDTTITGRLWLVRRFAGFTNEYPWRWRPQDVEGFTTSLRSSGSAHSTIRGYHRILALFVAFVCDPRYGWVEECETRFGQAPALICHEVEYGRARVGVRGPARSARVDWGGVAAVLRLRR